MALDLIDQYPHPKTTPIWHLVASMYKMRDSLGRYVRSMKYFDREDGLKRNQVKVDPLDRRRYNDERIFVAKAGHWFGFLGSSNLDEQADAIIKQYGLKTAIHFDYMIEFRKRFDIVGTELAKHIKPRKNNPNPNDEISWTGDANDHHKPE